MPVCPNCEGRRKVGILRTNCPTCGGTGELVGSGGSASPHETTLYLDGQKMHLDRGRNGTAHRYLPGARKV